MQQHTDFFRGKKVTVMGLGRLGRGVGDAMYIAAAGASQVLVTDQKTEAELAESVAALRAYSNVSFRLGEHREEDFTSCDLVLVAAGVPKDSPYLEAARRAGITLAQSAALFASLSGVPIIGVTGTRGKSTVTHLIHHVLSTATGERVLLGGNVRGVSNLQLLHEVEAHSLAVMELDSWQLQGFAWAGISPQIAVFTSFMEDHLNYYQRAGMTREEAMSDYFNDKANIFRFQDESGVLVTTPEVFARIETLPETLGQEVVLADASVIPEDGLFAMPGAHNRQNAALAFEALRATSLDTDTIFSAFASFPGVPGRLQYVRTIDNVRVYNDNNATTPSATAAALEALDLGNRNIILIAGGADKALSLDPLYAGIDAHVKALVLVPGSGTERLLHEASTHARALPMDPVQDVATDLAAAWERAREIAVAGDIILFSPGFASFGQYANEYERNDHFLSLVTKE